MRFVKNFDNFIFENITFTENSFSIPQMRTYDINWNGKKAGNLDLSFLSSTLKPDEIEISFMGIDPEYRGNQLNLGRKSIEAIWKEFPRVNKIFLQSIETAKGFWKKMGAIESAEKENYSVIYRPDTINNL